MPAFRHLDKSLTVAKYYGWDRGTDLEAYYSSDFVFTTYYTISLTTLKLNST